MLPTWTRGIKQCLPPCPSQPAPCSCRLAFVAPAGCVLLSADYCQLELRIMAHLSQDCGLVAIFTEGKMDPFSNLAQQWMPQYAEQV